MLLLAELSRTVGRFYETPTLLKWGFLGFRSGHGGEFFLIPQLRETEFAEFLFVRRLALKSCVGLSW
jgi:hypothetical protein